MRKVLVAGLGPSAEALADLSLPEEITLLGVNDFDRIRPPDHLLVLDASWRFTAERRATILGTLARTVWLRKSWPDFKHPDIRAVFTRTIEEKGKIEWDACFLPHFQMSPFAAVALARKFLGATDIGLIGVDLDGHQDLERAAGEIDRNLGRLGGDLSLQGCHLWNLSGRGLLQRLPRIPLEKWAAQRGREERWVIS